MIILRRGIIPPVSGPFTPLSLPNLLFWYKADTLSSSPVTSVADQSGNSNNLVNSGTVNWTSSSAYNSKPAIVFVQSNTSGLYTASASISLTVTNTLSVFVVGRYTSNAAANAGLVSISAGANNDYDNTGSVFPLGMDPVVSSMQTYYNNSAKAPFSLSVNTNFRVGTIITSSGCTLYLNGSSQTSASFSFGSLRTPTYGAFGNRYLGAATGTSNGWDGPVLEIIGCAADITSYVSQLDTYFTVTRGF